MRLYHGSDMPVEQPNVSLNRGFADLGRGFYLTDRRDVAVSRAATRAARLGGGAGAVSEFEFREDALPWVTWGEPAGPLDEGAPFGLRFADDPAGLEAWIGYIASCRAGRTCVEGLGEPAVVRAWIATEEVEMACSGLVSPADVAGFLDPEELVVQYCFRSQEVLEQTLAYLGE